MWRDAHIPRVSRCAYSGKTPGNCTENLPSSPPCRGWPDCLAVGGVRSEPVSSPRCGYCPSSAAQRSRGSSWELGALGEPSLDFAPGVGWPWRETGSDRKVVSPGRTNVPRGGCGPPGSSRHDQLLAESHTISPSRTALLRLTGTLYRALEPRSARELASL